MQEKEKALQASNKTRPRKSYGKYSQKLKELKAFIHESDYIDPLDQPQVCAYWNT